ncbi:unnamed protein product [Fraxinus pennsylvanica]|uniref:Uncharacterized protein n=1 Tax=Fraxinus pennsylvanica TaxID=56036 RepID=A0AAD1ZY66_9LAMI|nr:unnamed protein product [Fraxinus pennsylvanica]
MGDRRSSFSFRFWPPASRRSPTTAPSQNTTIPLSSTTPPAAERSSAGETTTPTPAPTPITPSKVETQLTGDASTPIPTTPSTAETQSVGNAKTPTTPTTAEIQSAGQSSTITPIPTTLPTAETQTAEKATNPTTNTISTTLNTAETQADEQATNPTINTAPTTPPTAETQTAGHETTPSSTTNTLTTPLTDETQTLTPSQSNTNTTRVATVPPSSEAQMANQPTATSIGPTIESQTSSPIRSTVQPGVPSRTASPYHATTKSQSPPQPSSPSRASPKSRATPSSPSRMGSLNSLTRQSASQAHSPSRPASPTPKQTYSPSIKGVEPTSTSKTLQHTTKEISHPLSNSHDPNTVSNGEAPKPSASEQESLEIQPKTKVKSDTVDDSHNQTASERSIKHNEMEVETSKSSEMGAVTISTVSQGPETAEETQKWDSSSIDGDKKPLMESNAKPEETKEVKEVIQETKGAADGKRNNEGNDFLAAKSGSRAQTVEEASVINESEQMHGETQGTLGKKETLPTSLFSGKPTKTSSRPGSKSTSIPTQKLSTQSSREQVPLHKEIKDDISTFVNRMAIGNPKNSLNDRPVSIITLAGENRGASMQFGSGSSKGKGAVHIRRGYKINPDESPEAATDGNGSWNGKKSEDAEGKEDQPTETYVNNNAQGINNSIVFNSSMNERNPGVHIIAIRAQKEPTKSTDKIRALEN